MSDIQAASEPANDIDEMSQTAAHMNELIQQSAALAQESAASATSLPDQIIESNKLFPSFPTRSDAVALRHMAAGADQVRLMRCSA